MAAVVRAGQTTIKLLVVILYICFSIGCRSGLDVFQIPEHRQALFVGCHPPYSATALTSKANV
jgi:hypothetical protein